MRYKKQEHRYVYVNNTELPGHIFARDAEVGYCGIRKRQLKEKGRISTVLRFREGVDLCPQCVETLKQSLAMQYGIKDW